MRQSRLALFTLLLFVLGGCASSPPKTNSPPPPRLTVVIVVDQMRADYLERFGGQFEHGFARLLAEGLVFANAHHDHAATFTAVGHAALVTGRHPSSNGIFANKWPDRSGRRLTDAARDEAERSFDGEPGMSPRRLIGTTIGDWSLGSTPHSQVVSISGKSRAAVMMGGHRATEVYWYSNQSGAFTTSTYYSSALPRWVRGFNARRNARDYSGEVWQPLLADETAYAASREDDAPFEIDKHDLGRSFPHRLPSNPHRLNRALTNTPFVDELTIELASEAVEALRLGSDDLPDLLLVSLSAADYVGHTFGPFSREIHDLMLRLDRMLGTFLEDLDRQVGRGGVLVVLTSDHGVTSIPAYSRSLGGRAGWVDLVPAARQLEQEIEAELGDGQWVLGVRYGVLYLDSGRILAAGGLPRVYADRAAELFGAIDGVARVVTRDQLLAMDEPRDSVERRLLNSFHPGRGGDVFVVLEPGFLIDDHLSGDMAVAANHGSPYPPDSHVPLIFVGAGVQAGTIQRPVLSVDVAPTIAAILGVEPTEAVDGTVLPEVVSSAREPVAAGF